ncbi:MAG: YfhO family protein [Pyrinomonadaceae bacterium]
MVSTARVALSKHVSVLQDFVLTPLAMSGLAFFALRMSLAGCRNISTFQDNTYLIHPLFSHIARSFGRGEYPYWMNTLMAGLPLYNTPQFSVTYPFYFFQAGLYGDPLSALIQIHYLTVFHILVLYVNTYVLLRVLRLGPLAAIMGAALLAFSPNTFVYSIWINTIAAYCWFPLVIAAVVRVLDNEQVVKWVLLGAASFGLLILASPAQPFIHALFIVAVLYLSNLVRRVINRDAGALLKSTGAMAVMALLTFSIAAPAVLPAYISSSTSIRFIGDFPPVYGDAPIPFEGFLVGQLEPAQLAATLFPLQVPVPLGSSFIGLGAALLALFAVFKARANWVVIPLLLIALYALLSATGEHLGFAQLNHRLPFINKIREPPRHLFLFVFSASVLAAFGFSHVVEKLSAGYKSVLGWSHLSAAAVFGVLLFLALRADLTYMGVISKPRLLAAFGVTVGMLLLLSFVGGRGKKVVAALAALSVVYSTLQYSHEVPRLQDGDYFSRANLVSHNTLASLAGLPGVRDYRIIFADDKLNPSYWSMNASYYDLRSYQAYMNPLPFRQFNEVFQRFDLEHYYPLLGARYYLCRTCDPPPPSDYRLQSEINGYKLYVAERALPRYFVVSGVAGAFDGSGDFFNKVREDYDYAASAMLESKDLNEVGNWLAGQPSPPQYVLREEGATVNSLRLSVNTEGRALFVFNEYYSRDWKARINGRTVRPLKVNLNQIGLRLERGANLVELEYHPTLFIRLLWVQRATWLLLILFPLCAVVYRRLRTRRAGRSGSGRHSYGDDDNSSD